MTTANNFNFGKMTLELVSATESKNGGHILKLQNKDVKSAETPFGLKTQKTQHTFYMKVDAVAGKVGDKHEMNLDEFKIIERPYTIDDDTSENNGDEIMLKWLSI